MEYIVKTPLLHDGKWYNEGDSIKLASVQAKPLLELGAIEEKGK